MNNEQRLKTLRRFGKVRTTIVEEWLAALGTYERHYEAYLILEPKRWMLDDRIRYNPNRLRAHSQAFAQDRTRYSSIISLYDKFKGQMFSICSSIEKGKCLK